MNSNQENRFELLITSQNGVVSWFVDSEKDLIQELANAVANGQETLSFENGILLIKNIAGIIRPSEY